tara:strand:- start:320 stop:484 length:165 start_codon:yes stop_codon:yes gene_type:complete
MTKEYCGNGDDIITIELKHITCEKLRQQQQLQWKTIVEKWKNGKKKTKRQSNYK